MVGGLGWLRRRVCTWWFTLFLEATDIYLDGIFTFENFASRATDATRRDKAWDRAGKLRLVMRNRTILVAVAVLISPYLSQKMVGLGVWVSAGSTLALAEESVLRGALNPRRGVIEPVAGPVVVVVAASWVARGVLNRGSRARVVAGGRTRSSASGRVGDPRRPAARVALLREEGGLDAHRGSPALRDHAVDISAVVVALAGPPAGASWITNERLVSRAGKN